MASKKGKEISIRPDSIVEARYQLTPSQNDVLDIFLMEIEDQDENKLNYELEVKNYVHLFGKGKTNVYRDLKEAVLSFEGKGFRLITDKEGKKGTFYHWFSKIAWDDNQGRIVLEIGQSFKQILIEMIRKVYYRPEFPLSLSSTYSKRLYYMLKQFEDTGIRIDDVDTLREKLECPVSYNRYCKFKSGILEVAKREINKTTDITIDYEEIYRKNKVVRLKFLVKKKRMIEVGNIAGNVLDSNGELEVLKYARMILEDRKDDAEKYLSWTIHKINIDNIKTSRKAYIKKVLKDEQNKLDFIEFIEQANKRESSLRENEALLIELDMVAEKEKEERERQLMEEYNVDSIEELHRILEQKWSINKVV